MHSWCQRLVLICFTLVITSCGSQGLQNRPSLSNEGLNSTYPDEHPALSANGKFIVFSSSRSGNEAIYLYDSETKQLVDLPGLNSNSVATTSPDISADGRYIVYLSNALGKSEVFLFDRTTSSVQNISGGRPGDVRNPSISADGRYIAFESNGLGQWHIEIFDRGSAATAPISNPAQPVPSPSP